MANWRIWACPRLVHHSWVVPQATGQASVERVIEDMLRTAFPDLLKQLKL